MRGSGRFKENIPTPAISGVMFQSPSLRGSGRFSTNTVDASSLNWFQSPSLRGSGRFLVMTVVRRLDIEVSIPFIAGQWSLPVARRKTNKTWDRVSIPFIAGQWSLRVDRHSPGVDVRVSIPFIAGQWSLLDAAAGVWLWRSYGFNPLHCGAVVASRGARTPTASSR